MDEAQPMQARFAVSTLLIAAACLYGAAPASAQGNTGFYLEGNLGYAFPDSVDASASGVDGEIELKDAFVFGGALGYRWPWVRLELNGSYIGPTRGVERLVQQGALAAGRPWLNPLE
jgi:opacity protein-like surface antigen